MKFLSVSVSTCCCLYTCGLRVANVRLDLDNVHIKLQGGTCRRRKLLNLKGCGEEDPDVKGGRHHDRLTMLQVIIPVCIPPRAAQMHGPR